MRWRLGSPSPGWGSLTRQMFLYISIIFRLTRGSSWPSSIFPGRCSPPSLLFGWCNRAPWGHIFGRWTSRRWFVDNDLSSLHPSFHEVTLILDCCSAAMLRCSPRRFLLSVTLVITLCFSLVVRFTRRSVAMNIMQRFPRASIGEIRNPSPLLTSVAKSWGISSFWSKLMGADGWPFCDA